MKIKKEVRILILILVASLFITACSPKAVPDQPTPPPAEQPTENPLNPSILGDCYNSFFPVMEGKVWKYAVVSGDAASTQEVSYKNVTSSGYTSVMKSPDISTEVQWTCSPDGMLSNQFPNMNMIPIPDVQLEFLESKGVFIPIEDKWQVGYAWNMEYTINAKYTSGDTILEGQGNLEITNTIAATESVTVSSGTYNDAFRVDSKGIGNVTIMGTEFSMPLTNSTWYVKDIGMVKSASSDPTNNYSMELTSLD